VEKLLRRLENGWSTVVVQDTPNWADGIGTAKQQIQHLSPVRLNGRRVVHALRPRP